MCWPRSSYRHEKPLGGLLTQFNFGALSGFEFERLVRDLLQAGLGLTFQSGAPGPDGGVDLKAKDGAASVVAQCKQYSRSGVPKLLRTLERDEVPKVRQLGPSRYILVTSLPLTHAARSRVRKLFEPYCLDERDVLGEDDLNQWLTDHPAVIDRHVKLWLTSDAVLRRVLNAGVFEDTALELERARREFSRYVVTPSLGKAIEILEREHVCVIAGLPGIGKTTLARVLLTRYEEQGFEIVRVPNRLSQVLSAMRRGAKLLFYFDDFLGQTALETRERNEDQRLADFMDTAKHEPGWRFVLTTREYILEGARLESEAIDRLSLERRMCVIALDQDYTPALRARVLYQHLYFSDLPEAHSIALLRSGLMPRLLAHPNYSPRLVGLLTSRAHARADAASEYPQEVLETFRNPERLWDVAYRAMDAAVQDMAILMLTLPPGVALGSLEVAYEAFRTVRVRRFNSPRRADEAREALRVLDGTMVATSRRGADLVVSFHNPSVRDYLSHRLVSRPDDVRDLIEATVYLDQAQALFEGVGSGPYTGVEIYRDRFIDALERTARAPRAEVASVFERLPQSRESPAVGDRAELDGWFLFKVTKRVLDARVELLLREQLAMVGRRVLREGVISVADGVALATALFVDGRRDPELDAVDSEHGPIRLVELLLDAIILSVAEGDDEGDMLAMARLLSDLPEWNVGQRTRDAGRAITAYGEYMLRVSISPDSPQYYYEAAVAVQAAAELIGCDATEVIAQLQERARETEMDEDEAEPEPDADDYRSPGFDASALFDRLEGELRSRAD